MQPVVMVKAYNFSKVVKIGYNNMKKGFTLIELLVVIAIIGVLAAIVMVSMSGATDKAKDARIKGDISQLRSIAGMIYDDDSSYADLCTAGAINTSGSGYDTQTGAINTDITDQDGSVYNCLAGASTYCVEAVLASGDYFCIDNTGLATTTAAENNCTSTTISCS